MTTNSVVTELNKGIKLNGNNYDIWYLKVQNLLELQDSIEVITNIMTKPRKGNSTQHKRDLEFNTNKLCPSTSMERHLREMSLIIRELKNANSIITDEQQVQAVIRSFPNS